MRHLRHSWFADRNYLWIYVHKFFFMCASAAAAIYKPAYLLESGMSLPVIILSVAVFFGVSGMTAPLTYKYVNRIGVPGMMAAATVMNIVSVLLAAFADVSLGLGFLSAVFGGITCGMYYPVADMLEGMYVHQNEHRGKQYTFGLAMGTLGTALGAVCGGFVLSWGSFYGLAGASTVLFLISLVPFFFLSKSYIADPGRTALSVMRYFVSKDYKAFHLPMFGTQLGIIAVTFVPLFVFTILGEYKMLGIVMAAATCVELLAVLLLGHYIDDQGNQKALDLSVGMNVIGECSYIFLAGSAWTIFLVDSWTRIATNAFDSSFMTLLHNKVQKRGLDPIFFGAVFQLSLCVFEFIVLILFALLACWIGAQIFTIMFICSALGLILVRYTFPKA